MKAPIDREFRAAARQPHLWLRRLPRRLPVEQVRPDGAARRPSLPRAELTAPLLAELATLDDAAFRQRFAGTAIKRIGRDRFVRNVAYALGNSGAPETALPAVERLLDGCLAAGARRRGLGACRDLRRQRFDRRMRNASSHERPTPDVRAEWEAAV